MDRRLLRVRSVALTLALILRSAHALAVEGPGCEAGAPCPDADGDRFVACGCAPPGVPCDCDDGDPSTYPGAPEACNATKDFSCSGTSHAGGCPERQGCLGDLCVPVCRPLDDFGCDNRSACVTQPSGQRLCTPLDCRSFGCPPGFTCDDAKTCVPNCGPEVRCPRGQVCRGFGCADPCEGITCPGGAACNDGRCVASCGCAGAGTCPAGQTCDVGADVPTCIETACVGVACPSGKHCEGGACIDECAGVVCPPERVCRVVAIAGGSARGRCVDLCTPNPCRYDETCEWRDGSCKPPVFDDGGFRPDFEPRERANDIVGIAGGGLTCTSSYLVRKAGVSLVAMLSCLGLMALVRRRTRR